MQRRTVVTAAELERFPSDDNRYELVEGRLAPMSPVTLRHGRVVVRMISMLDAHIRSRRLGIVVTEAGFVLATDPDTVRAPDVAFVAADRVPEQDARGFFHGPPDLAVEVLSPDDRPADVAGRVRDYLKYGTPAVLVLDPDRHRASVHRRLAPPVAAAAADDAIDLDDVVPGFRCTVGDAFS
jgi:Uma2 family endonuclease